MLSGVARVDIVSKASKQSVLETILHHVKCHAKQKSPVDALIYFPAYIMEVQVRQNTQQARHGSA